jgi:hypothetical protein
LTVSTLPHDGRYVALLDDWRREGHSSADPILGEGYRFQVGEFSTGSVLPGKAAGFRPRSSDQGVAFGDRVPPWERARSQLRKCLAQRSRFASEPPPVSISHIS